MPHTHSRRLDISPSHLKNVQEALADIHDGKMVILVDDEDRENEGDLCMAAEKVSAEAINFMAKYGRGLVCVTLAEEQVQRLELPMMQARGRGRPPLGTAFTVSVEAKHGVTTGISARDRAHTIRTVADPACKPDDLVVPGHIFPLQARPGGVLVRAGQTEGSVDLARLSGLAPGGVICEIINDDGDMARFDDLQRFAAEHGLRIVTIADLIAYRLQTEQLVERVAEQQLVLDLTGTEWQAVVFRATLEQRQLLALIKAPLDPSRPALCRMHAGSILADTFSSTTNDGAHNLNQAILAIEAAGSGVVVYLPPRGNLEQELGRLATPQDAPASSQARPHGGTLREYGLGAQVLRELGLREIRLLTNNPRKIAGIHGYGLRVVDSVALAPPVPAIAIS